MSILWCGGEDVDFPVAPGGATVVDTSGVFTRGSFARAGSGIQNAFDRTRIAQSKTFGPVTSCWLSAQVRFLGNQAVGIGLSGSVKGLLVGMVNGTTQVSLWKQDGAAITQIVAEASPGTLITPTSIYNRIDMQIINYGVSATVNIYVNSTLALTYTGDITVTGMASLNCVMLPAFTTIAARAAEIVVADEDTRSMLGLLTLAPTGAGTTNQWTNNTFSNINPGMYNDANSAYTNTNAQDQQYNVTDEPATGIFICRAVKMVARAWLTTGAAVSKIQLGVNSGGSVALDSAQTASVTPTSYEKLWDATNPATSAAWGSATEINALQLEMRSGT